MISERTLGIRINLANWKTKNLYFLSSFEATVWQWADRRCMFQDFIYRCTMLSCSFSGLLMLTFISSVTSSSREFENLCLFCSREFVFIWFFPTSTLDESSKSWSHEINVWFQTAAHPSLCWSFLIFYSYQASTLKSLFKIIWKFK